MIGLGLPPFPVAPLSPGCSGCGYLRWGPGRNPGKNDGPGNLNRRSGSPRRGTGTPCGSRRGRRRRRPTPSPVTMPLSKQNRIRKWPSARAGRSMATRKLPSGPTRATWLRYQYSSSGLPRSSRTTTLCAGMSATSLPARVIRFDGLAVRRLVVDELHGRLALAVLRRARRRPGASRASRPTPRSGRPGRPSGSFRSA